MDHDIETSNEPDFESLLESGALTPYFYKQLTGATWLNLDSAHQPMYLEDALEMSRLGINSKDDTAYYYMAFHYAPDWLEEMLQKHINEPMRRKIATYMYSNRDRFPVGPSQIDLYDSATVAAAELGLPIDQDVLQGIEARRVLQRQKYPRKLAYPQGWSDPSLGPVYDIRRWMKAMRDIYAQASKTGDFGLALQSETQNWGKMEQIDFKHWLRFYQEGVQNKYKIARYISPSEGGYYVPKERDLVSQLPMPLSMPSIPDYGNATDGSRTVDVNDARLTVEKQRSKIISRLNAAEKLLSSLDGQLFAGEDQEFMLKLLQDLKRKVQIANKIRIRSSLFEDFIYRAANFLNVQGKAKAASFFYKIAQEPAPDDPASVLLGDVPPPPPPPPPKRDASGEKESESVPGEAPPELGGGGPGLDPIEDTKASTRAALKEFFHLLETGVGDVTNMHDTAAADDADIVVYAQVAPEIEAELPPGPAPEQTPVAAPAAPVGGEVAPAEESTGEPRRQAEIDDALEAALKNITVQDVVKRLDLLSGLFKKREIARQLAIIDMMLDRLGIGTFFPSLGEATRSALESNQYVATRIEDVLSRLRGSVETKQTEQFNEEIMTPTPLAPGVEGISQGLINQEQEEEARKAKRREREEKRMEQPTMEEAAPQELQGTPKVEQAAPVPVR